MIAAVVFVGTALSGFQTEEITAIVAEGGLVPAEDVPTDSVGTDPAPPTTPV